jgi:hypothetical protein
LTFDGVDVMGERLAEEVRNFVFSLNWNRGVFICCYLLDGLNQIVLVKIYTRVKAVLELQASAPH